MVHRGPHWVSLACVTKFNFLNPYVFLFHGIQWHLLCSPKTAAHEALERSLFLGCFFSFKEYKLIHVLQ